MQRRLLSQNKRKYRPIKHVPSYLRVSTRVDPLEEVHTCSDIGDRTSSSSADVVQVV